VAKWIESVLKVLMSVFRELIGQMFEDWSASEPGSACRFDPSADEMVTTEGVVSFYHPTDGHFDILLAIMLLT